MKENIKCPICGNEMNIRMQNNEHVNSASKKVYKHKHYQYFCIKCDDDKTGWTTTESDTESIGLK